MTTYKTGVWCGLLALATAVAFFYPHISERLLLIAAPSAITAPLAMLLLALMFKRNMYQIICKS